MVCKIISVNVNGLRAAYRKGLFKWLKQQNADIVCFQETRVQPSHVENQFNLAGYQKYFCHARKKGYSGVAIYTRYVPDQIINRLGWKIADEEGRYLQLDFKTLSIASIYFPSGSHSQERQQHKMEFLKNYFEILKKQRQENRQYILCGDWNIAHTVKDLKNWKANQKNSGFLPEERAWFDQVLKVLQYVDAFRVIEPGSDHYTWWSSRGKARANNVGWRIDYQIITPELRNKVSTVSIYKTQNFSDHAPLVIGYKMALDSLQADV